MLLTLWSAVVLMLMSPDSPIHGPWNRIDSAFFYMCGKAMMNGLQPYVDFADSKGPLLWLIYGVGYLLSPTSYTGVYVVSCFWYAGIFFFNFKTVELFLKDHRQSLLVTLLMAIPYFLYWFHFEVRAENFATLPVAVSLFYMCRLLWGSGDAPAQPTTGKTAGTVRRCGLVLGGCFMALVLMKWSIAAMQAVIILVALWHYWRVEHKLQEAIMWIAVGAVAVALPFVVYLSLTGSFTAFIQEYFLNTIGTAEYGPQHIYIEDLQGGFADSARLTQLAVMVFGSWLLGRRLSCYRYVPLLTGLFFHALATVHYIYYYPGISSIFAIYLFIGTFLHQQDRRLRTVHVGLVMAGIIGWGVLENIREDSALHKVLRWNDRNVMDRYKEISAIISETRHARLLYLYSGEVGYGLDAEPLPAGKYWAYQLGAPPEMEREHIELLRSGKADYVIVSYEQRCSEKGFPRDYITSLGYSVCYQGTQGEETAWSPLIVLYRKVRASKDENEEE